MGPQGCRRVRALEVRGAAGTQTADLVRQLIPGRTRPVPPPTADLVEGEKPNRFIEAAKTCGPAYVPGVGVCLANAARLARWNVEEMFGAIAAHFGVDHHTAAKALRWFGRQF